MKVGLIIHVSPPFWKASITPSATPVASGPRHSTVAPEARHGRGHRRDAERSQMAETVSKAHERFSRFSQERYAAIVHAPGFRHIGGSAYFVWAYPPNC